MWRSKERLTYFNTECSNASNSAITSLGTLSLQPDYEQVIAYISKDTHRDAKNELLSKGESERELIQERLCLNKKQGSSFPINQLV